MYAYVHTHTNTRLWCKSHSRQATGPLLLPNSFSVEGEEVIWNFKQRFLDKDNGICQTEYLWSFKHALVSCLYKWHPWQAVQWSILGSGDEYKIEHFSICTTSPSSRPVMTWCLLESPTCSTDFQIALVSCQYQIGPRQDWRVPYHRVSSQRRLSCTSLAGSAVISNENTHLETLMRCLA